MQYHVVDMANIQPSQFAIVEGAFALWKEIYSHELKSRHQEFHLEDFWNGRLVTIIEDKNIIIACHVYNVFDVRLSMTAHKYFNDIPKEQVEALRRSQTNKLMSMEYLLVNPEFRGRKSKIRWGEVLIGLGFRVMEQSPWDAIVGIARADKGVNTMGMKMGAHEASAVEKFDTPCRVMLMTKAQLKDHDDPEIQAVISSLWETRSDSSPWIETRKNIKKAA